jgi:hypothetical protein
MNRGKDIHQWKIQGTAVFSFTQHGFFWKVVESGTDAEDTVLSADSVLTFNLILITKFKQDEFGHKLQTFIKSAVE